MYGLANVYKCSTHCCSVTQSCLNFCDPMDCSMPGFPVPHHLLAFAQTHAHWIDDTIQPFHPLSSPSPLAVNLSQHQGLFKCKELALCKDAESWLFASRVQSSRDIASTSILPMNIQGWFSLEFIGLISLLSKGLSRVFSRTTVQKHQFFSVYLRTMCNWIGWNIL